ncbi:MULTISPECIES: hypothetical protein [Neisseria]|uniref:Uncharacterized protein n=2 Tax=Neisseria mucosa TaxID=488 RepID=D2ZZJ3_NEIM2|nr:hypothetical protein [Neisseria mucosa]EFC87453.1 hypothetical protein NEIMUCOT_06069 [Neisseria mucosa ATCC 25996]SUA37718.1 Uncharacterised protein [Neisseria mucosa]
MKNHGSPNNLIPMGMVLLTFIICAFVIIFIIAITNWGWIKEAYAWIINNNESIIKLVSLILFPISFFLYSLATKKYMINNTTEEMLNFFSIPYTLQEDSFIIKTNINYWLECIEKITVLVAIVSIYLTIIRFFSVNTPVDAVVSIVSILIMPISIVFLYMHYSMKILTSLIFRKYTPVKFKKEIRAIPSSTKEKLKEKLSKEKLKEILPVLFYILLVSFVSTVMIFYFPIIIGVQMAPTKQEPLEYCQIKNLPPQTQNHCKEKSNLLKIK